MDTTNTSTPSPTPSEDSCKHAEKPDCGRTCECTCDSCQNRFETEWDTVVERGGLCEVCGIPKELTFATLKQYEHTHFFLPCPSCRPAYLECMQRANLCEDCRHPLSSSFTCPDCDCSGKEDCRCRECRSVTGLPLRSSSPGHPD